MEPYAGNPESRGARLQAALYRAGLGVWLALGVVLLVIALRGPVAAARAASPAPRAPATAAAPVGQRYSPDYELKSGDEVLLVFVGASFCGANRRPGFSQVIEEAKLRLREQARARGRQFRAVAVSLDWKPADALAFLDGFGEFDEISVGSNWINESAFRYVWRELPGDPVLPQLLIVERHMDAETTPRVSGERVVRRLLGTDQIAAWAAAGARL